MRRRDFIRRMGAAVIGVGMLGSELLARAPQETVHYLTTVEISPELAALMYPPRNGEFMRQVDEVLKRSFEPQLVRGVFEDSHLLKTFDGFVQEAREERIT